MQIQPLKALKSIDADLDFLLKNQPYSGDTVGFFELYIRNHADIVTALKKKEYIHWYIMKGTPYHPEVLLILQSWIMEAPDSLNDLPLKRVYRFLSTMTWESPLWYDKRWINYLFYLLQNNHAIEQYRSTISEHDYFLVHQRYVEHQHRLLHKK